MQVFNVSDTMHHRSANWLNLYFQLTYTYQGEHRGVIVACQRVRDNFQYEIFLSDQLVITISPAGVPTREGKTIWLQSAAEQEQLQPHDLIQAIGEGLEKRYFPSVCAN